MNVLGLRWASLMAAMAMAFPMFAGCSSTPSPLVPPILPTAEGELPLEWRGILAQDSVLFEATLRFDQATGTANAPAILALAALPNQVQVPRQLVGNHDGEVSFDAKSQLLQFTSPLLSFLWCLASTEGGMASFQRNGSMSVLKAGGAGEELISSTKAWIDSASETDSPGIFSIDLRPNKDERTWAENIMAGRHKRQRAAQVRSWLVDPAFERAFAKPLREMSGPEARGLSHEFSRTTGSGVLRRKDPYPGYRIVCSILRALNATDYVHGHAAYALFQWHSGLDVRLAKLDEGLRSLASIDRQESFASTSKAHLPKSFAPEWQQALDRRRRELGNPALETAVLNLIAASQEGKAPPSALGNWRLNHQAFLQYADNKVQQECQSRIDIESDRILPAELAPSYAELERVEKSLYGLAEGWLLYSGTRRRLSGLETRPKYREWVAAMRLHRDPILLSSWEEMRDLIGRASPGALTSGLPSEWFGVEGDSDSPVYPLASAALEKRRVELRAERLGEALAPFVAALVTLREMEANRVDRLHAQGKCERCSGDGQVYIDSRTSCTCVFGSDPLTGGPCTNGCSGGYLGGYDYERCPVCDGSGKYPR